MKNTGAGDAKAQCPAAVDEWQSKRDPVLVLRIGEPVANTVLVETEDDPLALFRTGSFWSNGDLDNSPIVDPEEWKALR